MAKINLEFMEDFKKEFETFNTNIVETHATISKILRGDIGITSKALDEEKEILQRDINEILRDWDNIAEESSKDIDNMLQFYRQKAAEMEKTMTTH